MNKIIEALDTDFVPQQNDEEVNISRLFNDRLSIEQILKLEEWGITEEEYRSGQITKNIDS